MYVCHGCRTIEKAVAGVKFSRREAAGFGFIAVAYKNPLVGGNLHDFATSNLEKNVRMQFMEQE
jgi:hypothetical protein